MAAQWQGLLLSSTPYTNLGSVTTDNIKSCPIYFKIEKSSGQLRSFSLSGGYMSLSISFNKEPCPGKKKKKRIQKNSKALKCHEWGWWKCFFLPEMERTPHRASFHSKNSFPDFLQTSLQHLQGELAVKPREELSMSGTESYSGAVTALPFLPDRISFFLAVLFSPFLSFPGITK